MLTSNLPTDTATSPSHAEGRRRVKRLAKLTVAGSLGLLVMAGPATALAADGAAHASAGTTQSVTKKKASKAALRSALKRYQKSGKAKDRAVLMSDRKGAKQVVDRWSGRLKGQTTVVSSAAGKRCVTANRYIVYRTLLNSRAFDWHGVLKYCVKGGKVVSAKASHYLANANSLTSDGGFTTYGKRGLKTKNFYITLKGEVRNEIPVWGTWTINHPVMKYHVKGNGKYTVSFTK